MTCERETELIERINSSGPTRREICNTLNISYTMLGHYLNGFTPMPTRVRMQILKLIEEREGGEK